MPNPDAKGAAGAFSGDRFGLSARLRRWAGCCERARGWQRYAAAFAAGLLSVLAMAPFFVWPVLFVTLPVLVWLIDGAVAEAAESGERALSWKAVRAAAATGWWFGFGYFLAGLYWIGEAFLVEAEIFAVLLPFAVTLLPAGLALFYAAGAALAVPLWRKDPGRAVALALALSLAEYARGHVLTGFPWNALGYALTYPLSLMQSAALFGVYGLTLIAVLVLALPLVLAADAPAGASGQRTRRLAAAVAILPILAAALWGHMRLATGPQETVPGVRIRIVQPSVPQREKWRPENQERIFLDHLALSQIGPGGGRDGLAGISHVVWPEAAMPFLPLNHPAARAAIGRMLPPGTLLISGGLRAEDAPPGSPQPRRVFNSLFVFGEAGRLVASYDKTHLVPFGEYLPFQAALEAIGLQQLVRLRGGFAAGPEPRPLFHLPPLPPAAPLICYEAIFPGAAVQGAERPGLLINVTNDGWFGNTTGPRQHLHQARVRSVEEGLPMVRAANNGISAAIDGQGRILAELGLDRRGAADSALPVALPPTPYVRFGDGIFAALWLTAAAGLAAMRRHSGA